MSNHKLLNQILGIEHPIIMAPMFLVSNVAMTLAAAEVGITGCIPALNYRTNQEFRIALDKLKASGKIYGINLIVNQSNFKMQEQLDTCIEYRVPFIITSLGNPKQVIEACHRIGTKVFCDVSDMNYARKAAALNPDALIAVTNEAGGHLGQISPAEFVPMLCREFPNIPIISAGGVSQRKDVEAMIALGAAGVSVGSLFIASVESPVTQEYKQACVDYGAADIVITTKLSGTPCTVINTDYVKKIGTEQNFLEKVLSKNKHLKKWFKMLVYMRGMKKLQQAAFNASYQNVWCAGKTIEHVTAIKPVSEIVKQLID